MNLTDEDRAAIDAIKGAPGHVYVCARCGSEMIGHKQAYTKGYLAGLRAGMERAARICEAEDYKYGPTICEQLAAAIREAAK